MKKEKSRKGLIDNNIVITADNIEKLSKVIALSAIKHSIHYAYGATQNLIKFQNQLRYDICYRRKLETYSDGYDLVQEVACVLCRYIGHKLGEIVQKYKNGKIDTIRSLGFKAVYSYLRKQIKHINNEEYNEVLETLTTEFELDKEQIDYTKVNLLASKLIENKLDSQILEYYYNNVAPKLIAEFLKISVDVVYRRKRKFKDRYMMYCNI